MAQPAQEGSYILPFFDHQIIAASSSREFDRAHYPDFLKQLGIPAESLQMVKQVHGDEIHFTDGSEKLDPEMEGDGLITDTRRVAIAVRTADCLPVFFWDAVQKIGGVAHAGWRGVKAGIIPKMIREFRENFDSRISTIQTAIGPSIRACCYEVGDEFQEYFPKHYQKKSGALKGYADISGAAKDQLLAEGVLSSQIFDSGICTACENRRFFSARREKTDERILSVLFIK